MAVRAYCQGYDLFHPHKMLLWHYYTRNHQPRHWNDDPGWVAKNKISTDKVLRTLGIRPAEKKTPLIGQASGER